MGSRGSGSASSEGRAIRQVEILSNCPRSWAAGNMGDSEWRIEADNRVH